MPGMIKICPKCNSTNIRVEMDAMIAIGVPSEYRCENCGFMSYIFPEIDRSKVKNTRVKKPEQVKHDTEVVNTSFGKFAIFGSKKWLKVFGPLSVIISSYFVYMFSSMVGIDQTSYYVALSNLVFGIAATLLVYIIPDKMSFNQTRVFGIFVVVSSISNIYMFSLI